MKRFAPMVVLAGMSLGLAVVAMTRTGVAQDGPVAPAPSPAPQPPRLDSGGTVIVHLRKDILHAVSNVEWLRGSVVLMNNDWIVLRGDYGDIGEMNGMFPGKSNVWIPRAHVLMVSQESR